MEVGFPPARQSPIAGHANEYQILRDYLAFSVAIYNEVPSWYEYVAERVYNDFLPVREYYFASDMTFQGTGYSSTRNVPSLYSAWIFKTATVTEENPFGEGLHDAIWGLFNYEVAPGYTFTDGDANGQIDVFEEYNHRFLAYLVAYIYEDSDMLAMADYLVDTYYVHQGEIYSGPFTGAAHAGISHIMYVALRGLCDLEPSGDRYAKMELIKYNGSPLGQYTIRNAWNSDSAAAAFMKIKERTTAGHEHMDSGTFEIYYKGMLTSDGGCYDNDGHVHTMYYHDATISHNGLIIYNSSLSSEDKGYYSGGQKRHTESNNFEIWQNKSDSYTGTVTGRQHGYADAAETQPIYAYIAGDITNSYHSASVNYVGRRMLTVYTGDADFPMVFFVYDDVESKSASYEKRFLLQITSKDAPTISGNTVTTENGDGRLVLTSLSSNVSINGVGGRSYDADGNYVCSTSRNYLINGTQLQTLHGYDDGHWGRVEIVSNAYAKKATFMNVLYVTDKGQTKAAPTVTKISGSGVEGGAFGDVAALFATSRERATGSLSATVSGSGNVNYYVSGVAEGEWSITVNGVSYGNATATAEGGLLTFTAPAGSLEITKNN